MGRAGAYITVRFAFSKLAFRMRWDHCCRDIGAALRTAIAAATKVVAATRTQPLSQKSAKTPGLDTPTRNRKTEEWPQGDMPCETAAEVAIGRQRDHGQGRSEVARQESRQLGAHGPTDRPLGG